MLVIHCPFCGPRNESEFMYGGPKKKKRPESTEDLSDSEWVEYLTVVDNPMGPVKEKWWHVRGCGQWIIITRNTLTHEITQSKAIDSDD